MRTNWNETNLEDICIRITDGSHSSPTSVESGLPMASVKDLTSYGINLNTCRHISEDDFAILIRQGCQPKKGDVLVAKDGATALDTVCEIKQSLEVVLLSSVAILRPDIQKITSAYLRYFMDCETTRQYLKGGFVTGAAIPRVVLKDFKRCKVFLPPLHTQRKIASILSAYDDLIENNTRRIAILEEMAQSLYREWFVHFRFPGYEKNTMVESPIGMIPEGWEVKAFGELLKYHIGGGWGKDIPDEEHTEPAYVIRGTDIPDARYISIIRCPLRFHTKSNVISRYIQLKDIIFEVSGGSKGQPVGRALQVSQQLIDAFGEDVICASFCKVLRVNEGIVAPEILFLHLQEIYGDGRIEKYQVQSTGIINFKFAFFLESEMIIIPSQKLQDTFTEIVVPMLEKVQVLGGKNATLRRTRDLLLPKLISGELDVEALDIEVGGDVEDASVQEEAVVRQDRFSWGPGDIVFLS